MNIPKLPDLPMYFKVLRNDEQTIVVDVFRDWHVNVLKPWHADLFKDAMEVYGRKIENQWGSTEREIYWGDGGTSIHKALLINIQPIKEETAEDHLRELVKAVEQIDNQSYRWLNITDAFEGAKKFLMEKK